MEEEIKRWTARRKSALVLTTLWLFLQFHHRRLDARRLPPAAIFYLLFAHGAWCL